MECLLSSRRNLKRQERKIYGFGVSAWDNAQLEGVTLEATLECACSRFVARCWILSEGEKLLVSTDPLLRGCYYEFGRDDLEGER